MVVELLDGNGADPCATDANGWTGLHCCGYYSTAEHGKIAKELLNRDVNVRFSFIEILLWFPGLMENKPNRKNTDFLG